MKTLRKPPLASQSEADAGMTSGGDFARLLACIPESRLCSENQHWVRENLPLIRRGVLLRTMMRKRVCAENWRVRRIFHTKTPASESLHSKPSMADEESGFGLNSARVPSRWRWNRWLDSLLLQGRRWAERPSNRSR